MHFNIQVLVLLICNGVLPAMAYSVDTTNHSSIRPSDVSATIRKQIQQSHSDGSFTFGYELSDGAFRIEHRYPDGRVIGKYGYPDRYGQIIVTDYVSGTNTTGRTTGFQLIKSLLPVQSVVTPNNTRVESASSTGEDSDIVSWGMGGNEVFPVDPSAGVDCPQTCARTPSTVSHGNKQRNHLQAANPSKMFKSRTAPVGIVRRIKVPRAPLAVPPLASFVQQHLLRKWKANQRANMIYYTAVDESHQYGARIK